MTKRYLIVVAGLLLAAALPVLAQPRPGAAELPVTRIVLFSSGVGYFQRESQVEGNSRVDLQFHTHNINDLLKSLILQDQTGQVSTITYDNRDPVEKTLKSFAIDLTSNPTLGDLLNQVRGEKVEVVSYGEQGKEGQPTPVSGSVVGVQKVRKPVGKDQVVESEQLNLLTSEGLQGVSLGQVQRVRLLKPELEQEFRKALEVLATGHDKQKKTVSLNFLGSGKRPVRVGYVTEAPIWKTSYRLSLEGKGKESKAFVQGWAVVENTTDEDWSNVRLGLVSGRPISFQMDLYEPLFVRRPVVEPELFASLRPQTYGGNMEAERLGRPTAAMSPPPAPEALLLRDGGVIAKKEDAGRLDNRRKLAAAYLFERGAGEKDKANDSLNFREGVASAAVATELGEYFQYELEQPVSLPRQKSALLPIVNAPVEASKVSIFNEGVHAKFPLLGLRFKNTTGLHLMQGPVTVFEANTYAGDARVTDLQPNETRLVSYAVDLGTEVQAEVPQPADTLVAVKIYRGILQASHKVRHRKVYTVKNRSDHDRLVLVEHPYQPHLTLVQPEKAAERSRDVYRFEVKAKPNEPVKLEVVEEQRRVDQIALSNSPDDTIRFFMRTTVATPKVKEALEKALRLKSELAETQQQIQREEQALAVIEKDQARMRANMERVPQTSEAYKRYLKKFDDQETEIEKRRATVTKLQETAETQRRTYEDFLRNLNIE